MQLNRFDLNLLVALDALLQEKNVTRAAQRLFISQPAMSVALGRLREYFTDPLLRRSGRDLELTPRARALRQPAREALLQVRAAISPQAIFEVATAQRTFIVMIPDFMVSWLLPPVVRQVAQIAPGVRLQLESWSAQGPSRLERGELDLFVSIDNPRVLGLPKYPEALRKAELRPITWVCAVSKDHPEVGEELTRAQFLRLPHIYVRTPGDPLPVTEAARRHLGVDLDVRVQSQNVLEVPFILPGTPLIGIMPESVASQLASCLALRVLPLPAGLLPRRRVVMLWHRLSEPDPGHAWLRSLLIQASAQPA
jgi:DNA-binding transcriptional LysR family regulator